MSFVCVLVFFFKQKTAYEMRISDWSSDVCSSDLLRADIFASHRHAEMPEARIDRHLHMRIGLPFGQRKQRSLGLVDRALRTRALPRDRLWRLEIGRGHIDALIAPHQAPPGLNRKRIV